MFDCGKALVIKLFTIEMTNPVYKTTFKLADNIVWYCVVQPAYKL